MDNFSRLKAKICALSAEKLPFSLFNGKIGYALFSILDYACNESTSYPTGAVRLLQYLLKRYASIGPGFLDGNLGLLWATATLIKNGIIDESPEVMRTLQAIVNMNAEYTNDAPIRYSTSESIYPWGIAIMPLHTDEDTLNRYYWDEQLIMRICDCEKILCCSIPGVHCPETLPIAVVHSILGFALMAYSNKIYTHKAKQLVDRIRTLDIADYECQDVDKFVINVLLNKPYSGNLETEARTLSYIGLLSVAYDKPELLATALQKLSNSELAIGDIISQSDAVDLIGFALGTLYSKMKCCRI